MMMPVIAKAIKPKTNSIFPDGIIRNVPSTLTKTIPSSSMYSSESKTPL